jgi:KUP system potassium uptake protein
MMFSVMGAWWHGRRTLAAQRVRDALPLGNFIDAFDPNRVRRVAGTAIFMTRDVEHVPVALLHALKHYKILHERVVLMTVETEDVPSVPDDQRLEITGLGKGFYAIRLRYGFTDQPNVVRALAQCRRQHFHFNLLDTSFIIGREKLVFRPHGLAFWRWRNRLFVALTSLAFDATEFFRIPPNRVVELGGQVEI